MFGKNKKTLRFSEEGIERAKQLTDEVFDSTSSEITPDEFLLAAYRLGVPNVPAEMELLVDYVRDRRIERILLSLEKKGLVERVGDNLKMTEEGIKVAEELRRQENKKE